MTARGKRVKGDDGRSLSKIITEDDDWVVSKQQVMVMDTSIDQRHEKQGEWVQMNVLLFLIGALFVNCSPKQRSKYVLSKRAAQLVENLPGSEK